MFKFILKITFFAVVIMVFSWGVTFVIDFAYHKRVKQKFTKIFSHAIDTDIMIFGSSVAYHDIDPKVLSGITGMPAYNMGWDGIFFVQYNCLIQEYLRYENKCKYLIIACDFDNLGANKLISRPDLFYSYLSNKDVYNCLHDIEPEKIFKAYYIPGYKLTILNKTFYHNILFASNNDGPSGYEPIDQQYSVSEKWEPFNARYNEYLYNKFSNCVNAIAQKGINVILVMTPIEHDGYKLIKNADWIKDKYAALKNKDVFFLDYTTDSMCGDKNYFYNYSHLNTVGATKFSTKLANDLLNIMPKKN